MINEIIDNIKFTIKDLLFGKSPNNKELEPYLIKKINKAYIDGTNLVFKCIGPITKYVGITYNFISVEEQNVKNIADALRNIKAVPVDTTLNIQGIEDAVVNNTESKQFIIDILENNGNLEKLETLRIDNPRLKIIGDGLFKFMENFKYIELPYIEEINYYSFAYCNGLINVDIPNVKRIGESAFAYISITETNPNQKLHINSPKATLIEDSAFDFCEILYSINADSVITLENYAFYYCINLEKISLPKATSIGNSAFNGCKSLKAIILGSTLICNISNPEKINYGNIYVPDKLLNEYKTKYTILSSRIFPMSELPIE